MKYTIYKTTNKINGKIYIGKHQTENPNDDYLGSGKYLKAAIAKYGIENFEKEVLFLFDSEEEMNQKEKELVNEEFLARDDVYNLNPGGLGSWGYYNTKFDLTSRNRKINKYYRKYNSEEYKEKMSSVMKNEMKKRISNGFIPFNGNHSNIGTTGKKFSEETKIKMSLSGSGKNNSQYGKRFTWITDGNINKKIEKDSPIPEGWRKGQTRNKK